MNPKLLQLIKIASVFSIPLTLAEAQAQEFEPQLGEAYFQNDQVIAYKLSLGETNIAGIDFSRGNRLVHSAEAWNPAVGSSLKPQALIEFQSSENALREFAMSVKDFDVPAAYELSNADWLLARWDRDFPGFASTDLLPKQESVFAQRSHNDHFELVWTSSGFEIHCYKSVNFSGRCSQFLPAQLADVIPLGVQPNLTGDSNLILASKQSRLLPLFVILSNSGTVRTAMRPDASDLIAGSKPKNVSSNASGDYLAIISVVD